MDIMAIITFLLLYLPMLSIVLGITFMVISYWSKTRNIKLYRTCMILGVLFLGYVLLIVLFFFLVGALGFLPTPN